MTRRAIVALALLASCALTMGAGWLSGPRFGVGVGPWFAPMVRAVAEDTPIIVSGVAWNADSDCLYFDGTDDVAGADGSDLPDGSEARTVAVWVYDASPASANFRHFLHYGSNSNNQSFFLGFFDTKFCWAIYATDRLYTMSRSAAWKHFALAYPAGGTVADAKAYLNGELLEGTNGSGSPTTVPNTVLSGFHIGRWMGSTAYNAETKMAELAIFNRALSQREIKAYYPYRFVGTEPGLVRLYHMEEGSGGSTADSVGGKDATITGAVWSSK